MKMLILEENFRRYLEAFASELFIHIYLIMIDNLFLLIFLMYCVKYWKNIRIL